MIDVKLQDRDLILNTIHKYDLPKILDWYNDANDFKFATGIDRAISLKELFEKYEEVLICKEEFFLGIHKKDTNQLIGTVKGGINVKSKGTLWINSIVIDVRYQNRGYGTSSINLLTDYFYYFFNIKRVYISVVDKNNKAKSFWKNIGFSELRKMNNHIILDNEKQDIIIMGKELYKKI